MKGLSMLRPGNHRLPHWSDPDKSQALNPANYSISVLRFILMLMVVPGAVMIMAGSNWGPWAWPTGLVLVAIGFYTLAVS